ncbi:MAG: ABC transporter permease [Bryobacteraceae bacterium]
MEWLSDVRFSLRNLIKNPGFTAVAVAMLALGIGVNATVFTVTNAVLFKGFPMVANNDRIVYVSNNGCCLSYPDFEDYRTQAKSFEGMAITHGVGSTFTDGKGFAERLDITEVSANAFQLVGQHPIIGRDFTSADEQAGAPAVAMLSYGFWRSRYGKDPAVIGRTVRMNGAPTTFVGVMPEGFSFPQKQDLWVPLVKTAKVLNRVNHDTWMAFGPLKPGVSIETARAEILTIAKGLAAAYPATDQDWVTVQNFREFMIGENAMAIYSSMWGAVGFVLLISCANLANLLLSRALGRSREISVRIALGAGRWRIIRQLLIESVVLSGAGGVAGWWVAKWGVRAYALAMAHKESWLIVDYTMDQRVLGYLIAISIGTGLLFGLAPALRLSALDVNSTMKDGGRGATGGSRAKHLSSLLVTGEMALAIVLLVGAGVMIRSFLKVQTANVGVDTARLLAGEVVLPDRYSSAESQISLFDRFKTRLQALPGVESVAFAGALPAASTPRMPYEIPGNSNPTANGDERRRPKLAVMTVGPDYFHTLGAEVLSGREFNHHEFVSGPPVAIVNRRLAHAFWPNENALGKRLRLFTGNTPGAWLTVVGVVSDIVQNDRTRQRFDPVVYVPYGEIPAAWVIVRTAVPPRSLGTAFRRELQALDPDLPVYGPLPLAQPWDVYTDTAFYGSLFLIFAAIALLLASVGLYTVIAHSVGQRTQEIGVRMAMGATARDIRGLVLRQGMLPLGIGLAIGLTASLAVNRLLEAELVEVSTSDPVTLVVASGVLILAAMLGCLIPARRAMRVDPMVALRHE